MNSNKIPFRIATATTLLLLLMGCSRIGDQPDLGLVSGTISFEGTPLSGASVMFQPPDGRPAFGKTDANGKYRLIYIRNTPGCKTGNNIVSITTVGEGTDDDQESSDDDTQVNSNQKPVKEIVPAKYNRKSELVADVQPGKNTFDFDLRK